MTGVICGTGSAVPAGILENEDIAKLVETNDAWIQERTGIQKRHIAQTETTVSLAVEAAQKTLADAEMEAGELDLILVSTISSNITLPCAACEVQKEIGAVNAVCFDLNAACTGFVLAYNTAAAYLAAGVYRTALIIGSECLSDLTNWKDRGTCILFGDGAGAAVLKAAEGTFYQPYTCSDGSRGAALCCQNRYDRVQKNEVWRLLKEKNKNALPKEQNIRTEDPAAHLMRMDGQAVFKFAVRSVPEAISRVLEKNKVAQKEIDWFILHQANRRIVEAAAKRLKEPIEKFPMNLQEYGNTSSASIPILLDEMKRKNMLHKGQKMILAGFGAGLTWGASIIEWK